MHSGVLVRTTAQLRKEISTKWRTICRSRLATQPHIPAIRSLLFVASLCLFVPALLAAETTPNAASNAQNEIAWVAPKKNSDAAPDEVDRLILQQMEAKHIPGLALGVLREGKLVKAEGYGWADVEKQIPVTPDTVFQLQSITKTFTAAATMLLIDSGKLSLEDKVSEHLANTPASWSNITIRHLLTHTSGIKDFINEPTFPLSDEKTTEEIFESLRDRPLNFEPGEKYSYCNTGYQLLGMIIQKLTGQPWHEYVRERLLTPLGMSKTRLVQVGEKGDNIAHGYRWSQNTLKPGYHIAQSILSYPGGGLVSTVRDMAKWDAALSGEKVLKGKLLEQMWTPARFNNGGQSGYGFGFGIADYHGLRWVGHNGAHATGFTTAMTRFLRDKVTMIILTNTRNASPESIALRVARHFIPALNLDSAQVKPFTTPAAAFESPSAAPSRPVS